jgi:hypothetical protein
MPPAQVNFFTMSNLCYFYLPVLVDAELISLTQFVLYREALASTNTASHSFTGCIDLCVNAGCGLNGTHG